MFSTLRRCAYARGYRAFVRQRERKRELRADNELLRIALSQALDELVETHRAVRRLEGRYHDLRGAIPEVKALRAACDEHVHDYERLAASYRRLEIENRDLRRAMAEAIEHRDDEGPPYPDARSPFEAPFRVGVHHGSIPIVHHGSIADCPICRRPDPRSGVGPVNEHE